jgi:predicted RNA-binding Zn-ribbon protein involved in translation (DUF1610 family)
MIIDSANLRCDGCGLEANHPIMYMPEDWITAVIHKYANPSLVHIPNRAESSYVKHYCPKCAVETGLTESRTDIYSY